MNIDRPTSAQPIPENAKLVFKGILFDVYQWEQTLYDGSTITFEKVRRPDTVVVVPVLPDGRLLLSIQEQPGRSGFISALGGRVNSGEDPLDAARRELMEESGYVASEWTLWFAVHPTTKVDWVVFVFIAKGLSQQSNACLDAGEKIILSPMVFEQFLELAHDSRFIEKEMVPYILDAKYCKIKRAQMSKLFGLQYIEE